VDTERIRRYRRQSFQLLENAFDQMRSGRWSRSEDLLWGSLALAVKGVALSRGEQLDGEEAIRDYASRVGQERRDRLIRDAFGQLAAFAESVQRIRESSTSVDRLLPALEDVNSAVERLWEMVPRDDSE
jgi:hypothetical protein